MTCLQFFPLKCPFSRAGDGRLLSSPRNSIMWLTVANGESRSRLPRPISTLKGWLFVCTNRYDHSRAETMVTESAVRAIGEWHLTQRAGSPIRVRLME
jgi:hypothetical protein